MNELEITSLTTGYANKTVLEMLDVPPMKGGGITVLTGPNAAGKSTLLRAMAGLLRTSGSIRLNGQELVGMHPKERSSLVSFMPQNVPVDINLSVMEAVISALKASPLDAVSSRQVNAHDRALEVLETIGIAHLALENLSQLSGGQRQMASLARTIVRDPQMLLLDEPTSALDLKHQIKVMKLARKFADDGKIVILVLHDLNLALRWADQVIVMNRGQIAGAGTPSDAITDRIIAEVYGIRVRVEKCSLGKFHMMVDDEILINQI